MKNIIFCGLPGSGKGTVSKLLIEEGYTHLSPGDLLREEIKSGSELGKQIAARIDKGQMVSDEMIIDMVKGIYSPDKKFIFDGVPRKLKQAEYVASLLDRNETLVLLFEMPKSEIAKRIVNRRNCPKCGEIYNLLSHPPKKEDTCDKCGTVGLKQRADDNEQALNQRFDLYEQETVPAIEFIKSRFNHKVIDANQSPDQMIEEVKKALSIE